MYDRKTWIILALCGGLLVTNLYMQGQHQKAVAAEEAKKKAAEAANPQEATEFLADATKETSAELTVETPPPPTEEELVVLGNDKISYTLSNIGGGIKFATFADEFEVGSTDEHVHINHLGIGPIGALADPAESPVNIAYSYKADESTEGKSAVYIAKLPSGLIAKKTYSLVEGDKPGSPYLIDYKLELENGSQDGATIHLGEWSVFLGKAAPLYQKEIATQTGIFWRADQSIDFEKSTTFNGGMFSSAKSLINSDSDEAIEFAGVTNQFFATALQPLDPQPTSVWGKSSQVEIEEGAAPVTAVRAGLRFPETTLQPKQQATFNYRIFIGPKKYTLLSKMENHWGDGWGDLMQYGWFALISLSLNWLLNIYHLLFDGISTAWSWGLAIILLTITVRIIIWPLHAKSTRTMKRMSKLKPEMDKLREKYADDPNKLNMETMGLYRKYGINPLGGCLPMLIQIPIFFGFYRMLQYAVELRGQGFLWVDDLSQPDTLTHLAGIPINLLPVVMAVTSFLQIKMTPSTGDKMQQRIIMFMPLMFFFFCYNFASALALYWTTQNIFSIGQTWLMGKMPEAELKERKNAHKKSWAQRMAERQQELQKARQGGSMRDVTPDKKKKRGPRTGG